MDLSATRTYYVAVVGAWDADAYDITLNMFDSILCSSTAVFSAASGEITDGSGAQSYAANMNCKFVWTPATTGQHSVSLIHQF